MIPAIGIMLGFYIITRCLSLRARQGDRAESDLVKVFSFITIIVAVIVMIILLAKSAP
jgi:hypothetical protein